MIFLEVLQTLLWIGLHGLGAGLPSSGANFAEFVRKLEGLNETERLVNRSADWQIVDGNLSQILTVIDDEESAESDAFVLLQHSVPFRDVASFVCQQRDLHAAQSSLFSWRVDPSEMAKVRISRCCHDFASDLPELLHSVRKSDDFGGANEGKIERVKEEHQIFSLVILQRDVFEFAVNHGGSFEVRSGFSDERLSHFDRWSKINIRVEIWNIQIKFYTKQF